MKREKREYLICTGKELQDSWNSQLALYAFQAYQGSKEYEFAWFNIENPPKETNFGTKVEYVCLSTMFHNSFNDKYWKDGNDSPFDDFEFLISFEN